jgi:hypothetical protein
VRLFQIPPAAPASPPYGNASTHQTLALENLDKIDKESIRYKQPISLAVAYAIFAAWIRAATPRLWRQVTLNESRLISASCLPPSKAQWPDKICLVIRKWQKGCGTAKLFLLDASTYFRSMSTGRVLLNDVLCSLRLGEAEGISTNGGSLFNGGLLPAI